MSDRHDWMAGMTDFQRAEVARLESRIVSFEKRWQSLEADWNDCKKALATAMAELAAAIKERDALIVDRTSLIAECDCLRSERQSYWRIKDDLIAELAAMRQQRDEARGQTWYLLYGGTSVDGSGRGHYIGRTTDKEVARKHHAEMRKSPYSIGFVEIVTDTEKKQVSYYGRELETKKEGSGA